jgi:hypothetical protein
LDSVPWLPKQSLQDIASHFALARLEVNVAPEILALENNVAPALAYSAQPAQFSNLRAQEKPHAGTPCTNTTTLTSHPTQTRTHNNIHGQLSGPIKKGFSYASPKRGTWKLVEFTTANNTSIGRVEDLLHSSAGVLSTSIASGFPV